MSDRETAHYRVWPSRALIDNAAVLSVEEVPEDAVEAALYRERDSHRGIGERRHLKTLIASAVNQDFLDEICRIRTLEHLELRAATTARDLSGLCDLPALRVLKIDSPRNITDFTSIIGIAGLRVLFIQNAKHMTDLDWLVPLKDRLWSLGIEGSMWTMQRLPGLGPLAGFAAEAMFFTSVRLENKDLSALATCPNLKYLHCARFVPRDEFDRLRDLRPGLECQWFNDSAW